MHCLINKRSRLSSFEAIVSLTQWIGRSKSMKLAITPSIFSVDFFCTLWYFPSNWYGWRYYPSSTGVTDARHGRFSAPAPASSVPRSWGHILKVLNERNHREAMFSRFCTICTALQRSKAIESFVQLFDEFLNVAVMNHVARGGH